MQISPIKNQNFEKLSRNQSNRTKEKILKKKFGISLKKNLVPRMLNHRENLAKIKGKEAKFFSKNLRRA
jgi:hypothetical protein